MPPKRSNARTANKAGGNASTEISAEEQFLRALLNDPYSFKQSPCDRHGTYKKIKKKFRAISLLTIQ